MSRRYIPLNKRSSRNETEKKERKKSSKKISGLVSFRTCRSAAPKFPIERESQSYKSVCINVLSVNIHKATGEERCHVLHNIKSFGVVSGG